jgi:hypothetical protein
MTGEIAHMASATIGVPADYAFACLADPVQVGRWALGCMDLAPTDRPGLWRGMSLFDGSEGFVEVVAQPAAGLIDYRVGSRTARQPRIFIRIAPGPLAGLAESACAVAMIAWRGGLEADRWARLKATHEAEIWLLKHQIEAGWAAAAAAGAGR